MHLSSMPAVSILYRWHPLLVRRACIALYDQRSEQLLALQVSRAELRSNRTSSTIEWSTSWK